MKTMHREPGEGKEAGSSAGPNRPRAKGRPAREPATPAPGPLPDPDALRAAELRFRTIADHTVDFEFWTGPDGRFLYASPACQRIYGRAPAEFLEDPDLRQRVIHSEDQAPFARHQEEVEARRVPGEIEFRIACPDGTIRWIHHVCQPVFDEQGIYLGIRGSNRDVTGSKEAEAALVAREARLRLALDAARLGMWDWDIPTGRVIWNEAHYRMLGYEPDSIVPTYRSWSDRVHPDDLPAAEEAVRRAMVQGGDYDAEFRTCWPDGSVHWMEARGRFDRDAKGTPLRNYGVMWDTTERRQANRLNQALNAIHAAIHATPRVEQILQDVIAEAAQALGCDTAAVSLRRDDQWILSHAHGLPDTAIGMRMSDEEEPHALRAIREQAPLAIDDAVADPRVNGERMREWGIRSVLVVPLFSRGDPLGVVFFNFQRVPQAFGAVHLDFAAKLAAAVALALDNARLFADIKTELSEREKAEKALERERDLLQAVMNGAKNSHLVYLDREFNFVRVNETYAASCGHRPAEMIGRNHFALFPHAENEAIFARVRDSGEAVEIHDKPFEFPDQPERGVTYWDWTLTPVKDPDGRVEGLVLSLYETTAHKRAEERLRQAAADLRESEVRYRSLFNSMNEGFALHEVLTDGSGQPADYRFLEVNPAFEQLTGLRRAEVVGRTAREVLPGLEPMWVQTYGQVALTGESCHCEIHSTDLGRHYEVFAYCPAPRQFAAVFLDVTGRKQAEEVLRRSRDELDEQVRARTAALAESERKYRELVENANSIILRMSPEGIITYFNEYAETFFGYAEGDVLGRNAVGTIIPEVDLQGRDLRRLVADFTSRPERYSANENENMRQDGSRVWVHWSNRAICDPQGRVVEFLCVGTDITERRRMQLENERYQKRLGVLADRLAAAEERERWDISRYIHDTIVQNLSLSSMRLSASQKELARAGLDQEMVHLQATRLLVDEAIAECRTVMSELTPALLYELGLVPALKELADTIRQRHGIQVHVEEEGEPRPTDEALRGLLFQSARELIMNALKHAGPCEIRVRVVHAAAGIRMRIQDNGRGFDPSRQNGDDIQAGGFGLLNIRQRVESMGGRLEIESAPGQGTTALISLSVPDAR
jgi:PAS domain S-box-containing protein